MYLCGPLVLLVEFGLLLFFVWQPVNKKNNRTIQQKSRDISCAWELLESPAFPSTCVSNKEKLVTGTAQNTRPKDILFRKLVI